MKLFPQKYFRNNIPQLFCNYRNNFFDKWVRSNISAYGGDPECVTLMGYSVGGMIVDAMMSSPLSKGLFHRAIAMSGNASSPWVMNSRVEYCQDVQNKLRYHYRRKHAINALSRQVCL